MKPETPKAKAVRIARLRTRQEKRLTETLADLRAAVIAAIESGESENEMHRATGVNRMTIRDWLGKR